VTKDEIRNNPKQHGFDAFHNGMAITANPFRNTDGDADAFLKWEDGWKQAKGESSS